MFKKISFFIILLFLSGCIQQDLRIVLNSDGSGEYHIRKVMSQMEGVMIANIPQKMREKALAEQQKLQEEYPGGLKRTSYDLSVSKDNPAQYIETTVYSFINLGEAIPSLENLIQMGPRYAYRGNQFVIFRNREKEEWDGVSNNNQKDESYFNLTIELPVEPIASNGAIEGKKVVWKFDTEALKQYQKMPIGESFIEVSIPATAIQANLSPRLFHKKEKKISSQKEEVFQPLEWFNASFPIISDKDTTEEVKASLQVVFPVENMSLPVSYKDLKVQSLVVDGKEVEAKVTSESMGVFNGKDQWGRASRGFPVQLEFPINNPWVKTIDKIEVEMKVNAVAEKQQSTFVIKKKSFPRVVIAKETKNVFNQLAISKVEFGSSSAMWPAAGIIFLSTIKPTDINAIFLDTEYGLRYKAEGVTGKLKKVTEFWDASIKQFIKENFSQEAIYEYTVGFDKIPNPPFNLVIDVITQSNFQPQTFTLENIDVSP